MNRNRIKDAQKRESKKLLEDFFLLTDEWNLSTEEQQKLIGDRAFDKFLQSIERDDCPTPLSEETITRVVMLLGIKNDLHILYPEARCQTYVRSPNKYFEGQSPLEVMLNESADGVIRVQAYLKGTILGGYT